MLKTQIHYDTYHARSKRKVLWQFNTALFFCHSKYLKTKKTIFNYIVMLHKFCEIGGKPHLGYAFEDTL